MNLLHKDKKNLWKWDNTKDNLNKKAGRNFPAFCFYFTPNVS